MPGDEFARKHGSPGTGRPTSSLFEVAASAPTRGAKLSYSEPKISVRNVCMFAHERRSAAAL